MTKKNLEVIESKIVALVMAGNSGAWMELLAGNAPELRDPSTEETFVDILWEHMVDEPLKLTKEEHWEMLLMAWTSGEGQSSRGLGKWIHLLKLLKPMDKLLKGLPSGEFEIYRGGYEWGLSWTLDKKKAKWFADRKMIIDPIHNPIPKKEPVSKLKVKKKDVIFYLDDDHPQSNGEQEVVVIPEKAKHYCLEY